MRHLIAALLILAAAPCAIATENVYQGQQPFKWGFECSSYHGGKHEPGYFFRYIFENLAEIEVDQATFTLNRINEATKSVSEVRRALIFATDPLEQLGGTTEGCAENIRFVLSEISIEYHDGTQVSYRVIDNQLYEILKTDSN